jgi:hypothetical protein
MPDPLVAAVDVGSPSNIGWWASGADGDRSGRDLDGVASVVAMALNEGTSVALGFEAPLYVPMPPSSEGLNKQRVGERGRPWCAGAGTGALAMGTQQAGFVFAAVARALSRHADVSFDPIRLSEAGSLVVWEAFVSAAAKDRTAQDPHVDDARVAVAEFRARLATGVVASDIDDSPGCFLNVAAAGLLAAGLTMDVTLLRQPCVVVRAPDLLAAS